MAEHELELLGRFVASAAAQLLPDAINDEIHTEVLDLLRSDATPKTAPMAWRLSSHHQR